jgi:hypothetical protein
MQSYITSWWRDVLKISLRSTHSHCGISKRANASRSLWLEKEKTKWEFYCVCFGSWFFY